jgi:hypothetical protein
MTAWDQVPLTANQVDSLIPGPASDLYGLAPSDTDYSPTWDLNAGAAEVALEGGGRQRVVRLRLGQPAVRPEPDGRDVPGDVRALPPTDHDLDPHAVRPADRPPAARPVPEEVLP